METVEILADSGRRKCYTRGMSSTIELLNLTQVARALKLNRETVRIMAQNGQIPGMFKMDSGAWRISEADLEKWLKDRAVNG